MLWIIFYVCREVSGVVLSGVVACFDLSLVKDYSIVVRAFDPKEAKRKQEDQLEGYFCSSSEG